MQVFKTKYILALTVFLSACHSPTIVSRGDFSDNSSQINEQVFVTPESFRVGVLLPLSGTAAKAGQGLKNATMIALEDMNNPNLILQYYDTQSSPEGARVAAENALNQQVKMIIGPLMSSSVEAISPQTRSRNVPVVAFSTNEAVLQNQVYTLGLLIEEQVDRIIEYAASKGRGRFALLIPDNATGAAVARAAVKAAKKQGGSVVKIAFYSPNTIDFSGIIRELSDFDKRSAPVKKEKQRLQLLARQGDTEAAKALKKLKLKETAEGVDFDAVIIPESGGRLKSATAMFGYYDVFAPDVMFLGTSVWENTSLNKESTLSGAAYPVLSRTHSAYFNKKYQYLYGNYPNGLFTFAYDAVALSSALAKNNPSNLDAAITTPDGFVGISGVFRIFPNGKNQHSLDIMEIRPQADVIVDQAPRKFLSAPENNYSTDIKSLYENSLPVIFGKDEKEALEIIFETNSDEETGNASFDNFNMTYHY